MVRLTPVSGFRDFLYEQASERWDFLQTIAEVYRSFGFSLLETPAVESLDILLQGASSSENEKLLFKLLKRGEKLKKAFDTEIAEDGLRFDLTVPLARVASLKRQELRLPWKVFHLGPVWRADRPQKGRYREFIQCDVDILGAKTVAAEIAVLEASVAACHALGINDLVLHLNDRRLVEAMGRAFGFSEEQLSPFAILLDKKDKMSREELVHQFEDFLGASLSEDFLACLQGELLLEAASQYHPGAFEDLKSIVQAMEKLALPLQAVVFDPSLVRGMGYYTGPIFELRHASVGYSVGGGGRYDRLIEQLGGKPLEACGFSLGFERIALLLQSKEESYLPVVFMPVFEESLRVEILRLAQQLRDGGFRVDVYPDAGKLKTQLQFASDAKYRVAFIIGAQEWQTQIFQLKDLKLRTQQSLSYEEAVKAIEFLFTEGGRKDG